MRPTIKLRASLPIGTGNSTAHKKGRSGSDATTLPVAKTNTANGIGRKSLPVASYRSSSGKSRTSLPVGTRTTGTGKGKGSGANKASFSTGTASSAPGKTTSLSVNMEASASGKEIILPNGIQTIATNKLSGPDNTNQAIITSPKRIGNLIIFNQHQNAKESVSESRKGASLSMTLDQSKQNSNDQALTTAQSRSSLPSSLVIFDQSRTNQSKLTGNAQKKSSHPMVFDKSQHTIIFDSGVSSNSEVKPDGGRSSKTPADKEAQGNTEVTMVECIPNKDMSNVPSGNAKSKKHSKRKSTGGSPITSVKRFRREISQILNGAVKSSKLNVASADVSNEEGKANNSGDVVKTDNALRKRMRMDSIADFNKRLNESQSEAKRSKRKSEGDVSSEFGKRKTLPTTNVSNRKTTNISNMKKEPDEQYSVSNAAAKQSEQIDSNNTSTNCVLNASKFAQVTREGTGNVPAKTIDAHVNNKIDNSNVVKSKNPKWHCCDTCKASFSRRRSLLLHNKAVHLRQFDFACAQCNYKALTSSRLNIHIRKQHHSSSEPLKSNNGNTEEKDVKPVVSRSNSHIEDSEGDRIKCSRIPQENNDVASNSGNTEERDVKPVTHGFNAQSECSGVGRITSSMISQDNYDANVPANDSIQASQLSCGKCDFVATNISQLDVHLERFHIGAALNLCDKIVPANRQSSLDASQTTPDKPDVHDGPVYQLTVENSASFMKTSSSQLQKKGKHSQVENTRKDTDEDAGTRSTNQAKSEIVSENRPKMYCKECPFNANSKDILIAHVKSTHGHHFVYSCSECDFETLYKSWLSVHFESVHRSKVVAKDKDEDARSRSTNEAKSEIASEHGPKMHCKKCPFNATSKGVLIAHVKSTHGRSFVFSCSECDFETLNKSWLSGHFESVHRRKVDSNGKDGDVQVRSSEQDQVSLAQEGDHNKENRPTMRCKKCSFKSAEKNVLINHVRSTHGSHLIFSCKECSFETLSEYKSAIRSHIKFRHRRPFSCKYCDYITRFRSNFDGHFKEMHAGKNCELTIQKTVLMRNTSTNKIIKEEEYNGNSNLPDPDVNDTNSELSNKQTPMRSCKKCAFKTAEKSVLTDHVKSTHGRHLVYSCSECEFEAFTKNCVQRHVDGMHRKDTPFKCKHCGYQTPWRRDIDKHFKKVHPGEKREFTRERIREKDDGINNKRAQEPLVEDCQDELLPDLPSSYMSSLGGKRRHNKSSMNTETLGGLKTQCRECEFESTDKSALIAHVRTTHGGHLVYSCSECDFETLHKYKLPVHTRGMHRRETPFSCKHCDYTSPWRTSMGKHFKKSHAHINNNREDSHEQHKDTLSESNVGVHNKGHTSKCITENQMDSELVSCGNFSSAKNTFETGQDTPEPLGSADDDAFDDISTDGNDDDDELGYFACKRPGCGFETTTKFCLRLHIRDDHRGRKSDKVKDESGSDQEVLSPNEWMATLDERGEEEHLRDHDPNDNGRSGKHTGLDGLEEDEVLHDQDDNDNGHSEKRTVNDSAEHHVSHEHNEQDNCLNHSLADNSEMLIDQNTNDRNVNALEQAGDQPGEVPISNDQDNQMHDNQDLRDPSHVLKGPETENCLDVVCNEILGASNEQDREERSRNNPEGQIINENEKQRHRDLLFNDSHSNQDNQARDQFQPHNSTQELHQQIDQNHEISNLDFQILRNTTSNQHLADLDCAREEQERHNSIQAELEESPQNIEGNMTEEDHLTFESSIEGSNLLNLGLNSIQSGEYHDKISLDAYLTLKDEINGDLGLEQQPLEKREKEYLCGSCWFKTSSVKQLEEHIFGQHKEECI